MSNKNNAIQKAKPLKLKYVPPYFKDEFIKDCIELALAEEQGFWNAGIPSVEGSVLDALSAKYVMSVILGIARNDKSAFKKEILSQEWDAKYLEYYMQAQTIDLKIKYPNLVKNAAIGLRKDAMDVLNYYRIFYGVRMDSGWFPGTGLQGFCNVPILDVW